MLQVAAKTERLSQDVFLLRKRKAELESNIRSCDNLALLQRFKASLTQLEEELRRRHVRFVSCRVSRGELSGCIAYWVVPLLLKLIE